MGFLRRSVRPESFHLPRVINYGTRIPGANGSGDIFLPQKTARLYNPGQQNPYIVDFLHNLYQHLVFRQAFLFASAMITPERRELNAL